MASDYQFWQASMDFAAGMGSNLFVNQARDTAVNIVLGLLLVSVFLLPFLLFLVVAGYALQAMDHGVRYLLPGVAHYSFSIIFLGLICLSSLVHGIAHLRKRRWRIALLYFAAFPAAASTWFADVHSPFGLHGAFWVISLFPIFVIPDGSHPTRFQFLFAASAICAVIATNTGLLGFGLAARITTVCVLIGLFIWFVVDARQRWSGPKNSGPKAPLFPTHA